ncbi:MAG: hypothetical protein JO250_14010 [Armatimonadetes bacterium]|nr:hypothetical protein [Armatimonadota bacterium]
MRTSTLSPPGHSRRCLPRRPKRRNWGFSAGRLLLDTKGWVVAVKTVSLGDLSSSIVHPREVFQDAVSRSAAKCRMSGTPHVKGRAVGYGRVTRSQKLAQKWNNGERASV